MYVFAIAALLGLALVKLVDLVEEYVPVISKLHSVFTVAVAIAVTVALNFSMFTEYAIEVRNVDVGTWVTGIMIAGVATVWTALLGYLGAEKSDSKTKSHQGPTRIAA